MTRRKSDTTYHPETRMIHGQFHSIHWDYHDHIVPPITASAAYRLESVERGARGFQGFANPDLNRHSHAPIYIYDRLEEPSRSMLEDNLAVAEQGEVGVCFATGMAAISAAVGVLARAGDRIVAHRTLYGCTWSLFSSWLPRFGIRVDFVDFADSAALAEAIGPDVMMLYFETPTNPTLELIDIAAVRAAADRENASRGAHRKVFVVVDNTFATPFCQRPLLHGADVVVHSLTKNIGGFGTDMGGVVIGPRLLESDLLLYRKDFGAPLDPKAAWPPLVYGLPTLAVRSRRQMETAAEVARFLAARPEVAEVRWPGLEGSRQYALARRQMTSPDGSFAPGIIIYFVLRGSPAEARDRGVRMMDHLAQRALSVTLAVSLGQIRTLVEHPASMTHAAIPLDAQTRAGIDPGGVRLSVGLEDPRDVIRDLTDALEGT